jgi:hypothetical protein
MMETAGLLTIGFVPHHVEALPFLKEQMMRHGTLVLEEPPVPGFQSMLSGHFPVDDYLLELDSEFPRFDRLMCTMMREFHGRGRRILQLEPYLEKLIQIHELFAEGKRPVDVMTSAGLNDVYEGEKKATGALIAYYAASLRDAFPKVVQAVQRFARADAGRFLLRDRLRARAIAAAVDPGESVFVEAGSMHYPLYRELRGQLGRFWKIRVLFPLQPVIRRLKGKRRNLGPGDVLTLLYVLHHHPRRSLTDLLAARSLIYIKLIDKDELMPGESPAPHAQEEARVNRMVDRLSFEDCEKLYHRIRSLNRDLSLQAVEEYISSKLGIDGFLREPLQSNLPAR